MTKLACNTPTHKHCPICKQVLPRTEFYKAKSQHDGLQTRCKKCNVQAVRDWQKKNPEKHSKYNREWDKRNPQKKRDNHLKWRLGLPYGSYDRMYAEQGGKCAICQRTDSGSKTGPTFHVDHCEQTKNVRGLLCQMCNVGIGHFYHKPELLEAAIRYLTRTSR